MAQQHGATAQGIGTPDSPHNFSVVSNNDQLSNGGGRADVCKACHVPHDHQRGKRYEENGMLWDAAVQRVNYSLYSNTTLATSDTFQPTGYSKMCLACHDGVTAASSFMQVKDASTVDTGADAEAEAGVTDAGAGLDAQSSSAHPISVAYDPANNANLVPASTTMGGSGTIEDILQGGFVQCSSCHDVHDQPGEAVAGSALLRASVVEDQGPTPGLCLSCHLSVITETDGLNFESFNCSFD
jgi:hypothetical protein